MTVKVGQSVCVATCVCIVVLGTHLVQEGSGACKIPNPSHLLWSCGTYMYFVGHVHVDPQQS